MWWTAKADNHVVDAVTPQCVSAMVPLSPVSLRWSVPMQQTFQSATSELRDGSLNSNTRTNASISKTT